MTSNFYKMKGRNVKKYILRNEINLKKKVNEKQNEFL